MKSVIETVSEGILITVLVGLFIFSLLGYVTTNEFQQKEKIDSFWSQPTPVEEWGYETAHSLKSFINSFNVFEVTHSSVWVYVFSIGAFIITGLVVVVHRFTNTSKNPKR